MKNINKGVRQIVRAQRFQEGAGVTIQRTIGTAECRHLDPFLMLDFFSSADPNDYIAGFPDHPHRGFITLTYMLAGHMLHQDHMVNRGELKAGGVQWMKAARGVIHSEMPQQDNGLMQGFQLWINLPSHQKMTEPEYQEFKPNEIPSVEDNNKIVKVISGDFQGVVGPIVDPHTQVVYLDVTLEANTEFVYSVDEGSTVFLFVFQGLLTVESYEIHPQQLAVLGQGERVVCRAAGAGARFIFVCGQPLHEPIVQYGPFVMNTHDEIQQAIQDFQAGRLTS